MERKNCAGFTLIELLIALSIFATLSIMAYGGIGKLLDMESQVTEEMAKLAELQKAFAIFSQDVRQLTNRSIRDEYGDTQPALSLSESNEYLLAFTRSGVTNPLKLKRSHLQRIAYTVRDNQLHRITWPNLDRPDEPQPMSFPLIEKVEAMNIRVLDQSDLWQRYWPTDADNAKALPRALEVTLVLDPDHQQQITRLFLLVDVPL